MIRTITFSAMGALLCVMALALAGCDNQPEPAAVSSAPATASAPVVAPASAPVVAPASAPLVPAASAPVASSAVSASEPLFSQPWGVAVDDAGNVYVSDAARHIIRKITPDGVVKTLAGKAGETGHADGKGAEARFSSPHGLAVDGKGNVYVADFGNYTVRKITPDGVVTTLAGKAGDRNYADGTGAAARFFSPNGIAINRRGDLYVADTESYTLRKITPDGRVSTLAGHPAPADEEREPKDGPGAMAAFIGPTALALDGDGNIYVSDNDHGGGISKVTPSGKVSALDYKPGPIPEEYSDPAFDAEAVAQQDDVSFPGAIAVNKRTGQIYIFDEGLKQIRELDKNGKGWILVSMLSDDRDCIGDDDTKLDFEQVHGLAVDAKGALYIADTANHTIHKVTQPVQSDQTGKLVCPENAAFHLSRPREAQ